jgi:hypothetical protein
MSSDVRETVVLCSKECEFQIPGTCSSGGFCGKETVMLVGNMCMSQMPITSPFWERSKRLPRGGKRRNPE